MGETIRDGKFVELTYKVTDKRSGHVLTTVEFPLGYVHGHNEILAPSVHEQLEGKSVDKDQLKLARNLVESMTTNLKKIDMTDKYHDALREMIEAKIEGKEIVTVEEEEKPVVDIMTALKQSIEQAKGHKKPMEKAKGQKKKAVAANGKSAKGRKTKVA